MRRRSTLKSMRPRVSMFTKTRAMTALANMSHGLAATAAAFGGVKAEQPGEAEEGAAGNAEDPEEEEDDEEDNLGMRREEWTEYLIRASAVVKGAEIKNEPAALFEVFRTTGDIRLIFATFARLFHLATAPEAEGGRRKTATLEVVPPWTTEGTGRAWHFPYEPIRVMLGGDFKAKRIWGLLDERASRREYVEAPCSGGRIQGRRCVVVGAGPCGIRAAIELRLLGANVTVVDQRTMFSRINQLHIWSWAGEDLKGLGAKFMDPPGSSFGANPDLMHITINELQKFLLKIALLLGVEVSLGVEYVGMKHIAGEWRAELRSGSATAAEGRAAGWATPRTSHGGLPPGPRAPRWLYDVAVLVGAGGFSSKIGEDLGMPMSQMGSLRRESAIGLICNLARTNGKNEGRLRSYAMARQFYGQLFKSLAEETGAELENVVYVKSSLSHYFVMTPTAKSLSACGVVKDPSCQPLLARGNIESDKLDALVQRVTGFPLKRDGPAVLEAILEDAGGTFPGYADEGPRLFDFSKMRRSQEGLKVLPPPCVDSDASGVEDDSLLAVLVGDSLVEPFWPEGLGVIRGFFSALDGASAVKCWAEGADWKKTAAHFDSSFTKLKTLSAATRAWVLQENEKKYAMAPETRYRL